MSAYVHPDNQQLLWNIVNSNSILEDTFSYYTPEQKDSWFKSIIELFYKKVGDTQLTKAQLHQLNKDTLAYMIQLSHRNHYSIQKEQNQALLKAKPPSPFPDPALQNMQTENTIQSYTQSVYTPSFATTNREELFAKQFQQREREYMSGLEVKVPDAIDFREKVEDTAISNMDELIKKHQQEREKEFQIYRPKLVEPPLTQPSATTLPGPTANITFEPVTETSMAPTRSTSPNTELTSQEIQQLKTRVHELSQDISIFSSELEKIKQLLEKTV
jgi:hypothetical protein